MSSGIQGYSKDGFVMSLNYSAYLRVGFIFKFDDLMKVFRTQIAEAEYRLEDRFNPVTGRKIEPVQVLVSPAKFEYKIGKEILEPKDDDDVDRLIWETLERRLGAEVYQQFEGDVLILVPSDELEYVGDIEDCGRVTFGSHLSYKTVIDAAPCVEKIRKGLLQLGLEPEQPLVIMDTTVG